MKNLPIRDLEPGMIIAKAIYTSRGQQVMEENTVLTAELISRLSFYSIYTVTVKDTDDSSDEAALSESDADTPQEAPAQEANAAPPNLASNTFYSHKVKSQPEFLKYQIEYNKEIRSVKEIFDAVIQNPEAPVDFRQILNDFNKLIASCRTTLPERRVHFPHDGKMAEIRR